MASSYIDFLSQSMRLDLGLSELHTKPICRLFKHEITASQKVVLCGSPIARLS